MRKERIDKKLLRRGKGKRDQGSVWRLTGRCLEAQAEKGHRLSSEPTFKNRVVSAMSRTSMPVLKTANQAVIASRVPKRCICEGC